VPGAADGGVRLASASQGTDREGNPEGHGYISAHMAPVGQTRKVLRRRAFSKKCPSGRAHSRGDQFSSLRMSPFSSRQSPTARELRRVGWWRERQTDVRIGQDRENLTNPELATSNEEASKRLFQPTFSTA